MFRKLLTRIYVIALLLSVQADVLFAQELSRYTENGKHGFKDSGGKIVIPAKYDDFDGNGFQDGLVGMRLNGKWGFIDETGKAIIPFKYEEVGNFSGGLGRYAISDHYGFRRWGIIDKAGKEITAAKYTNIGTFHDGFATTWVYSKMGLIDKNGKEIVAPKYEYISPLSEGMCLVMLNKKYGYIDQQGKELVPLKFDGGNDFHETLASVLLNGKWGFINKQGSMVIPAEYESADIFSMELAPVKKGGKWGFVDKTGKITIPLSYDKAQAFYKETGSAPVCKGDKWGAIDIYGNLVVEYKHSELIAMRISKNKDLFASASIKPTGANKTSEAEEAFKRGANAFLAKNYQTAIKEFTISAEKGKIPEAMTNIAHLYRKGEGVPKNDSLAFIWYKQAADLNFGIALYEIGLMYYNGEGVKADLEKGEESLKKAALKNHPSAKASLDQISNYKKSGAYEFTRASNAYKDKNYATAIEYWKKSGSKGFVEAMLYLGNFYSEGKIVEKSPVLAEEWLKKAANLGDTAAMYNLGMFYLNGLGIEQYRNHTAAFTWMTKVANMGDKNGLLKLGEMYEKGWGTKKNKEEALKWYRKALAKGHPLAKGYIQRVTATDDDDDFEWF